LKNRPLDPHIPQDPSFIKGKKLHCLAVVRNLLKRYEAGTSIKMPKGSRSGVKPCLKRQCPSKWLVFAAMRTAGMTL
jgi:hypothetical protein